MSEFWTDEGGEALDELDQETEATQAAPEQEVEAILGEVAQPEQPDLSSAVEERLELAQYYRQLLRTAGGLFTDDTPAAAQVSREVQVFIRGRLEVLMGIRQQVEQRAQFTAEEVESLKALAVRAKGLKAVKPEVAAPAAPPQVRKTAPPAAPEVKPAAPAQLPRAKQPAPKPRGPQPVAVTRPASVATDPRVPEQYRQDPTLRIKNGRVLVQAKNSEDEPLWIKSGGKIVGSVDRDVTLPNRPPPGAPQPIPMVSVHQSNVLQESRVGELLGIVERKYQPLAGVALMAINQPQRAEEEDRP